MGSAHASFWMPSAPSLDEVQEWLTIPFSSSKPLAGQYALKIVGPSINKTAGEGTYAICQEFGNGVHAGLNGKFVHAQRERQGEVEWTLKKVRFDGAKVLLCPHSDHKDHQTPLAMGGSDSKVTIRGIVIAWYRPA